MKTLLSSSTNNLYLITRITHESNKKLQITVTSPIVAGKINSPQWEHVTWVANSSQLIVLQVKFSDNWQFSEKVKCLQLIMTQIKHFELRNKWKSAFRNVAWNDFVMYQIINKNSMLSNLNAIMTVINQSRYFDGNVFMEYKNEVAMSSQSWD